MEGNEIPYEKYSHVLMKLGTYNLKHIVKLAHKDNNGKRSSFHNEYIVANNMYGRRMNVRSVKLNFQSYFELEEVNRDKLWRERNNIRIDITTQYMLTTVLRKILNMIETPDTFIYSGSENLIVNPQFSDKYISRVIGNVRVRARLSICSRNGQDSEGAAVQFIFKNNNEIRKAVMILALHEIEAFQLLLQTTNLYQTGLQVVTYISRPFKDANVISINDDRDRVNMDADAMAEEMMKASTGIFNPQPLEDNKSSIEKDLFG